MRGNGGKIGPKSLPSISSAGGMWSLSDAALYNKNSIWPTIAGAAPLLPLLAVTPAYAGTQIYGANYIRTGLPSSATPWGSLLTGLFTNVYITNGVLFCTVNNTGYYTFMLKGAAGGAGASIVGRWNGGGSVGGQGAYIAGTFYLTAGTQLRIVIGMCGDTGGGNGNCQGAGGGGTFVSVVGGSLLIAAGGGGGGVGNGWTFANGMTGQTGTTGGATGGTGAGSSGSGGSGGTGAVGGSTYDGSGGGGWLTAGTKGNSINNTGGDAASSSAYGGTNPNNNVDGGFGGGGAAGDNRTDYQHGAGGGGGYSGGGGAYYQSTPGGGGSFNSASSYTSATVGNLGMGGVLVGFSASDPGSISTATNPRSYYQTKQAFQSAISLFAGSQFLTGSMNQTLGGIASSYGQTSYVYIDLDNTSASSSTIDGGNNYSNFGSWYGSAAYNTSSNLRYVAQHLSQNNTGAVLLEIRNVSSINNFTNGMGGSPFTRNSVTSGSTGGTSHYVSIAAQWY